jgi:type IV pilus modification protein PilV
MRCRVNRSAQSGVTLIETMIAILVLSFGMLGMLSVFLNSLKITSTSHFRSIAAQQSYAIADSIRASLPQLTVYPGVSGSAVASCLTTAGCTTAQMAQSEVALWQARLVALLPSGAGTVCRDSSPADGTPGSWACDGTGQFVIKVCWDDSRVSTSSAIECVRTSL